MLARFGLMCCLVILVGCSSSAPPPSESEIHLKELAKLLGSYIGQNRGQRPPSEKVFKSFIHSQKMKGATQIDDIDAIFVSPRDKAPYVVRYGAPKGRVFAYEKVGVDGKRFVVLETTQVVEMNESELKKALAQ